MTEQECEFFEVAVIGSGFGGSIAAIELAKTFKQLNDPEKRVLILERGIWYITPEALVDSGNHVANFIKEGKRPYRFWVMPDNSKGSLPLVGMLRSFPLASGIAASIADSWLTFWGKKVNPNALYDVKDFKESFALVASGVGGGSMVYSNVTISPEPEIFDLEYKESERDPSTPHPDDTWKPKWKISYEELEPYMAYAKYKFIEVSKIFSVQAGYYNEQMILPKTKELFNAVEKLQLQPNEYKPHFELADLSITESPIWDEQKKQYVKSSTKFCRRQGRCNFGCLPGARHSLNKKLVEAYRHGLPLEIRELMDVTVIEPVNGGTAGYIIHCNDLKNNRRITFRAKTLVLAAGSFGTPGLILRSKQQYSGDPKRKETLDVTDDVGTSFSLNGDTFGLAINTNNPVYITRGPIDTAHVRFKKNEKHYFTIEDATIPRLVGGSFAAAIMRYLAQYDKTKSKIGHFENHVIRKLMFGWRIHPLFGFTNEYIHRNNSDVRTFFLAIMKRMLAGWTTRSWGTVQYGSHKWMLGTKEYDDMHKMHDDDPTHDHKEHRVLDELEIDYILSRVFFFACMGIDSANGRAKYDPKRKRLDINWDGLVNDPIYKEIRHGMKLLGERMVDTTKGLTEHYLVLDPMRELFGQEIKDKHGKMVGKMFALHPLGGCPMETYPRKTHHQQQGANQEVEATGAVDINGSLLRSNREPYPNLYIVDGSIIPTALGVNPSLTISGLAFKIVDGVTKKYGFGEPMLGYGLKETDEEYVYSVQKGCRYPVTFRETSKRGSKNYTIATVDPVNDKKYGNIVYVDGHHLGGNNNMFSEMECKGQVEIMKVEGRIAYGQLVGSVHWV